MIILCMLFCYRDSESFKKIDYKPESTILVATRLMTNKLFDFLTTYTKCASTTGQLANIPPTLISRSPFLHGSINKLKVGSGSTSN